MPSTQPVDADTPVLRYRQSNAGPPPWIWRVMILWSVLTAAATAPDQLWLLVARHQTYFSEPFSLHYWGMTAYTAQVLFGRSLEILALLILIHLLRDSTHRAMGLTAALVLGWCGLRVLAELHAAGGLQGWPGVLDNPGPSLFWKTAYLAAYLGRAANAISVPITCAILMRTNPSLRRAWWLLLSITVFVCLAYLTVFSSALIFMPWTRYPKEMGLFAESYEYLIESLPVLIVVITRRWRWMPLAIMAYSISVFDQFWTDKGYLGHTELIASAIQELMQFGVIATLAYVWHKLSPAAPSTSRITIKSSYPSPALSEVEG